MTKLTDKETLINDSQRLKARLKEIPVEPGCYLMRDKDERLLYVGKSKCLRNRVRSYFNSRNNSPRISLMIRQIFDIEIIVTDNEDEALVLEANLIKDNSPYFNILLKDDKKYPYLCITWSEPYPRIFITRRRRNRNKLDRFYGPYVDVTLLRQTLSIVKKTFPLRQRPRPLYSNRTCLNFAIGRCPGVCQKKITSEEYHHTIKKVAMVFQGRSEELNNTLKQQMYICSEKQDYENAALIRDQIKGLERLTQVQKMSVPDSSISRDVIAMSSDEQVACIQLFQMRAGKLVGRLAFTDQKVGYSNSQVIQRVVEQHYSQVESVEIPAELLLQYSLINTDIITEWLSELRRRKVRIIYPKRNQKAELIDLVQRNAELELKRELKQKENDNIATEDITQILELSEVPRRIECFDISHIQGSDSVASQVVFIEGRPAKHHYRTYKIKSSSINTGHSDDFMAMAEVIRRRFRKWSQLKAEGVDITQYNSHVHNVLVSDGFNDWPNLVVIDGGKGQLSAVFEALREMNLQEEVNICSIAKKKEQIFVPGNKSPLETDINQPAVILLRRLRDEAHRFAIKFHRNRRSESMTRSRLTDIEGLGPKRIKLLLSHFKSIQVIQMATFEELEKAPGLGKSIVTNIWNYFHPDQLI